MGSGLSARKPTFDEVLPYQSCCCGDMWSSETGGTAIDRECLGSAVNLRGPDSATRGNEIRLTASIVGWTGTPVAPDHGRRISALELDGADTDRIFCGSRWALVLAAISRGPHNELLLVSPGEVVHMGGVLVVAG